MSRRLLTLFLFASVVTVLTAPNPTWARGAGGGGGHAGGGHVGGGFAGGHGGGFGGHYGGCGAHCRGGRGYGWGYRGYGWGYPGYGYGLGLGLGMGIGYGVGYGLYGGYGYYGYPAYGYGYYGYPAYNYANSYGGYGYDPYGSGYSAGYVAGNTSATYSASNATNGKSSSSSSATAMPIPPAAHTPARPPSAEAQPFVDRGEAAFRKGDYAGAVQAFRHAAVDDPHNALITLMLGQALFATGHFDEAAGATQAAMRRLPKDQWGVIVTHYEELYGKRKDYTDQLHDLEQAIKAKPDEPGLRFLAGFHYAHLGFATEAVDQLEAGLKLAPRDEMARELRNELRAKLANPIKPPAPLLPGLPPDADDADDK